MKTDEPIRSKTIEEWRDSAEDNYLTTPISVLKYITVLEEQLSQQSEQSKWVECSDRLPEVNEIVLVTNGNDDWVCAGQINDDGFWYNQWQDKHSDVPIRPTHWAKLPTPPKSK